MARPFGGCRVSCFHPQNLISQQSTTSSAMLRILVPGQCIFLRTAESFSHTPADQTAISCRKGHCRQWVRLTEPAWKPVTLTKHENPALKYSKGRKRFVAKTKISRSAFKMTSYADMVADEIGIEID